MGPARLLAVGVVLLAGIGATTIAWTQADDDAREREETLAAEIDLLVEATTDSSVAAVAGAGGLVSPEGEVDLGEFESYGRQVIDLSPLESLAYVPVVTAADRAAFEADLGRP
ncbi:MAG: hypothetical protein ABIX10_02845, partial [Acidimicrobiales bacterium]